MKRVISLFSGAGTFDYGFHLAGWETVYMCEWDAKARQVLAARFPGVPIINDVCEVNGADLPDAELIMFGSPCQDLSVAGKRGGLEGAKSGLFMEAIRIIKEKREATNGRYPAVALWENVPGAFSSNGGRDFATVIHEFLNSGARDCGWRVLDAQFFGVPQRRRRIFLVADFAGKRAREILFEREGVRGNPQPGRTPGQGITGCLTGGAGSSSAGNPDDNRAQAGFLVPVPHVARCLTTRNERQDFETETLIPVATPSTYAYGNGQAQQIHLNAAVAPTLTTAGNGGGGAQRAANGLYAFAPAHTVRRLTPTECERLQGMPDGWGDVDGMADGHRYRFMGNGGAAPVLKWLAERIGAVL